MMGVVSVYPVLEFLNALLPMHLHCTESLFYICTGHFMDIVQSKVHFSRFTCTNQAMSKGLYACTCGVHTYVCSIVPGWHLATAVST